VLGVFGGGFWRQNGIGTGRLNTVFPSSSYNLVFSVDSGLLFDVKDLVVYLSDRSFLLISGMGSPTVLYI
jgi:hypothetical protein